MFLRRSFFVWLLPSIVFAVAIGAFVAVGARRNRFDIQLLQSQQRELFTTGPSRATSRFRNLSLQPEAAKLSKRLGQRFTGSESDVSVLLGEITTGETRIPLRIVRKQDERGESVEISANGRALIWSASHGATGDTAVTELDRSLIERLVFDSADAFVLAQLRGASYQVVVKNVRADLGGAGNYNGPLWTVVRVSYEGADSEAKPESVARMFYINSRTGLLDKVTSEIRGEEIEAIMDGWTTKDGETFPSVIRWSTAGRPIMELRVINFDRSSAR
jgi:hypothetical protein